MLRIKRCEEKKQIFCLPPFSKKKKKKERLLMKKYIFQWELLYYDDKFFLDLHALVARRALNVLDN